MTPRLLCVLADFLDRLADSLTPVDIGECGPAERYSRREAKALGPAVAALAADGLITPADIARSARPYRHQALVRRWLSLTADGCRQRAAEYRRQAAMMTDATGESTGPRQLSLF